MNHVAAKENQTQRIEQVPISIDYKDKHYKGWFSPVNGAVANVWYLYVDKFYYGRLMITDKDGFFTAIQ